MNLPITNRSVSVIIHTPVLCLYHVSNPPPTSTAHLQCDKEGDRLDRVVPPVDVVAHEQVVRVRRLAAYLEQLHQVVELAVHVAAHCYRTSDFLYVRLARQDLLRLWVWGA